MRQKSYERVRFPIQKQSRNSEILYLPKKRLEKALELIGALDHDKTFRLCVCVCVFFWREEINIMWKSCKVFLFLKLIHNQIRQYISLPSIVVTNRHSIVIAAERSVITLVVNMSTLSTCEFNWKGLNESAFPAHLYLS